MTSGIVESLRHFFSDNLILGALDLIDRDRGATFVRSLSDEIDRTHMQWYIIRRTQGAYYTSRLGRGLKVICYTREYGTTRRRIALVPHFSIFSLEGLHCW